MKLNSNLLLCFILVVFNTLLFSNGETVTSKLMFDFDECFALTGSDQHKDYSEFIADNQSSESCNILSAPQTIYRSNPERNNHSCTEGFNGLAMCISSLPSCTVDFDSDKKLIIPFNLNGSENQVAILTGISFQHQAPTQYSWIQGASGRNNPPSKYAYRILKNNIEVFRSDDNTTNANWNLKTIQLPQNEDFSTNEVVTYHLEILPYCLSGTGSVTAWDIDDVMITASCRVDIPNAGILTTVGGAVAEDICLSSEETTLNFLVDGSTSVDNSLVITDEQGIILGFTEENEVDFEGAPGGLCFVYNIAFEGDLENAEAGNSLQDLAGCFALSNSVQVNRVAFDSIEIHVNNETFLSVCAGIPDITVVNSNPSISSIWVAADSNEEIIAFSDNLQDLDAVTETQFYIFKIEYLGELNEVSIGSPISNLSGCFTISNSILIQRLGLQTPVISSAQMSYEVCSRDGISDLISFTGSNPDDLNSRFVITSPTGEIYAIRENGEINFDGLQLGECRVYFLIYDGNITGLVRGANISNVEGCLAISSNSISINKVATGGGVFATSANTTSVNICRSSDESMLLETVLRNNTFPNIVYPLVDMDGVVISFLDGPMFDLTNVETGSYRLYALSFEGDTAPTDLGAQIADLAPSCELLSNPITLSINNVVGSSISTALGTDIDVCFDSNDGTEFVNITEQGGSSAFSSYVVTDLSGNILSFQVGPRIFVERENGENCQIWNVRYAAGLINLGIGNNLSELDGCYEVSNPISVTKRFATGGVISTVSNTSNVQVCTDDANFSLQLNNNLGDNSLWVITDVQGTIITSQEGSDFDFTDLAPGNYRVWHAAYNGEIENSASGNPIAAMNADCIGLSNFVQVALIDGNVSGGTISISGLNSLTVCPNNLNADFSFDLEGNTGASGAWVVVNRDGTILSTSRDNVFGLAGINSSQFDIFHIAYNGQLGNLSVANNINNVTGCFTLSNAIEIVQSVGLSAGTLQFINGGQDEEIGVCVGIGTEDAVNIEVEGANATVNQLFITDEQGNILGITDETTLSFEGAPVGTCLVYNIASDEAFSSELIGTAISDLSGCFAISNALRVVRNTPEAGVISINGTNEITICTDASSSALVIDHSGQENGMNQWLITDEDLNILAIQESNVFNFEGVDAGVCLIWRINSFGDIGNIEVGSNASTITGCVDLSNAITITRETPGNASTAMSQVVFDFDDCNAIISTRANKDYSEFTGEVNNASSCGQMSIERALYRQSPNLYMHSCTPGIEEGVAMCVSSSPECTFEDDSDFAIRFEVGLSPSEGMSTASLSGLSFYEQAPDEFTWINGESGPNKYPVYFGIRILKDDVEIYQSTENPTSADWTLQTFNFEDNAAFTVDGPSTFSFEILAYCLSDVESTVTAWDIEHLEIKSDCSTNGGCEEVDSGSNAIVQGRVKTTYGEDISNVALKLGEEGLDLTNNLGLYAIKMKEIKETYMLAPNKNDDAVNGLSVLDLIMVQRHILGLSNLEKSAKLMASDVNFDNKVTAADIIGMRRVLLGLEQSFANNRNWIFYSAKDMVKDDLESMKAAPNEIMITEDNYMVQHDFMGVKIGDVDGSAVVNEYKSNAELKERTLNYSINKIAEGEFKVDFYADNDMLGAQFAISTNGQKITSLLSNGYEISSGDYSLTADQLKVVLVNEDQDGYSTGDVILSFIVNSEMVPIIDLANSDFSIAVSNDLTESHIQLNRVSEIAEEEYVLFQNEPNPFSDNTSIKFSLPSDQQVQFFFFSIEGRLLHSQLGVYSKGINYISLSKSSIDESGVVIYKMKTKDQLITKKMIIIE